MMLKHLITIALLLFSVGAFSRGVNAQQNDWHELSPSGESYRILMPGKPHPVRAESGISGDGYESSVEGATYSVMSLFVNTEDPSVKVDQYLDAGAEIIWEKMLKPVRDLLPEKERARARMSYVKELSGKPLPGREYSLAISDRAGTTQFFLARGRLFVLLEMHTPGANLEGQKFFDSFTARAEALTAVDQPRTTEKTAAPSNPNPDPNRVFSGRDVTQKARVLSKPEPTYTESARKFSVTGTVVLRAVFSGEGKVTNLHLVSGLPHGLTQRAIDAARRITFEPAQLDGRPVSMWMELQYNFNLY